MKLALLALLVTCTLTAAMVPRLRRDSGSGVNKTLCLPQTPCAWAFYSEPTKIVIQEIENTYCICEHGKSCQKDEDDTNVRGYVYRCKTIKQES